MATGFSTRDVQTILFRDGFKCAMCGRVAQTANHRANRGAGGHKASNTLANGCAICHDCNGRIEDDADYAEEARRRGVKLSRFDDPTKMPYLSPLFQIRVLLTVEGGWQFQPEGPIE